MKQFLGYNSSIYMIRFIKNIIMLAKTLRILPLILRQVPHRQAIYHQKPSTPLQFPRNIVTTYAVYKKAKTKSSREGSDSEDERATNNYEDSVVDKTTTVKELRMSTLRLDGLIKSALNIARNKIEVSFYESKIRLNGEKVSKKSETISVGDEIDIVKGAVPSNPNLLTVARIEVLNIRTDDDTILVKVRRCKSLLIENYENTVKT